MGEPDIGAGIGVLLRQAREDAGESRQQVSQVLRIRRMYLEAIEDGRYQDLPGPAYASGFIRTYADHLGLDSDEIIRRFRIEAKDLGGKATLNFPVPVPETGIPGGPVLLLGLVISAVAYGAWTFYSSDDSKVADLISPLPDHLSVQTPSDAAPITKDDGLTPTAEAKPQPVVASDDATTSSAESRETAPAEPVVASDPASETPSDSTPETPSDSPQSETTAITPTVASAPTPATKPSTLLPGTAAVSGSGVETQSASAMEGADVHPSSSPPAEAEPPVLVGVPAPVLVGVIPTSQRQGTGVETGAPVIKRVGTMDRGRGDNTIQVTAIPAIPTIPPVPEMPAIEPRKVRTYGEESGKSRILLRARVNSWVQIRDDINNRLLVTRLLKVGDSVRVPDRPGLKLMTGNAGGLDILVDGEVVPPIGPLGAVRRNVTLDVETLRRGTAGQN